VIPREGMLAVRNEDPSDGELIRNETLPVESESGLSCVRVSSLGLEEVRLTPKPDIGAPFESFKVTVAIALVTPSAAFTIGGAPESESVESSGAKVGDDAGVGVGVGVGVGESSTSDGEDISLMGSGWALGVPLGFVSG